MKRRRSGSGWRQISTWVEYTRVLGFELQAKLSSFLKTDAVDFVVMNGIKSIELAHAIIADGECLVDRHFDRDSFERHIQHEYQDHKMALHRNGFKE